MSDSLSIKHTVREMVATYQHAAATIRTSFSALHDAELRLNAVFAGRGPRSVCIETGSGRGWFVRWDEPDVSIARLRRDVWGVIVERMELQRMLSTERWAALNDTLDKGELPDITEENIAAFVRGYMVDMPNMLTEMVGEVFEWLRPRLPSAQAKLKTNKRFEIGPKVIVGNVVRSNVGWPTHWGVQSNEGQRLIALENVFNALSGRGQIAKTYRGNLWDAIEATPWGTNCGETDLFKFRLAKNGNLHLEFKRLDLLARFNQIAGGNRLKTSEAT